VETKSEGQDSDGWKKAKDDLPLFTQKRWKNENKYKNAPCAVKAAKDP